MKSVQLSSDGKSARLGPGLTNGEVLRVIDALGKRTGKRHGRFYALFRN